MFSYRQLVAIFFSTCVLAVTAAPPVAAAPSIDSVTPVTAGPVGQYEKFEVQFWINGAVSTNPYFPYDPSPPTGVDPGIGITVDALLLPPGESNWANAVVQPCFFYLATEEAGSGNDATLLPVGGPEGRFRFAPDETGVWQYKLRGTDAAGTSETAVDTFTCVESDKKGYVGVSPTDFRWMEFSDGTPFVTPLINAEAGNPLNGLSKLRAQIPQWADNGVRFVRWFPTGEGANFAIYPFGDWMLPAWGFGSEGGAGISIDADTAMGKKFSFVPYKYSGQRLPAVPGGIYRLTFRAKVEPPGLLIASILGQSITDTDSGGWADYVVSATNTGNQVRVNCNIRDDNNSGLVKVHSISLQRDTTGSGDWGPNLLAHPDPDSYAYVDQRHAALYDEVFELSEELGVYHRVMIVHKQDQVLGRINADGSINTDVSRYRVYAAPNQAARWYQQAWWRYVIARWSCYTSLHSIEFANENDPASSQAFEAGWALAEYFHNNCPRPIIVSNSFWHSFPLSFWNDARMDMGDEHAYLNNSGNPPSSPYHSHSLEDSALSTRQCWEVLKGYGVTKPVIRGETGIFDGHWSLGWYPDLALDTDAVYEHKKLWAHVGLEGYQCDGQWNTTNLRLNNNWRMYGNYNEYMDGEQVSNGNYNSIGTDLTGSDLISTTETNIRMYGMRDTASTTYRGTTLAAAGRMLLWIDNKNHTWRNVVDGAAIPAVSGQLTVPGLPQGTYNIEWWDTEEGEITGHSSATVGGTGQLTFSITDLETDLAVKVSNAGANPVTVEFQSGFSERPEVGEVLDLIVILSSASTETVTVDYEVMGGTADGDGVDYLLDGGTLEFLPGETEQSIQLTIVDDPDEEPDETIEIGLSRPVNAVVGNTWTYTHRILGSELAGSSGWEDYE